jgi:hypothetical protein
VNATAEACARIAELPGRGLASEADVKLTIVLPLLRALGYDDADFNDEGRTGRGRVDVVVERVPVCLVVETKSPHTQRTDEGIAPLETSVFHQHTRDRAATVAMLTNGEWFLLYGVIGRLQKGCLKSQVLYGFQRSHLGTLVWVHHLVELLAREPNEGGTIPSVITKRQEEMRRMQARLHEIEMEIQALTAKRQGIDAQIRQLESERASIGGCHHHSGVALPRVPAYPSHPRGAWSTVQVSCRQTPMVDTVGEFKSCAS